MKQSGELGHEREFQRAWTDPDYTTSALPPLDVNQVIADHYRTSEPFTMTRTMLWDMEVRKARNPDRYLPSVMRAGSVRVWGEETTADSDVETFVRSSMQHPWLDPSSYGLVIEQVRLDRSAQKVTFIGATEIPDEGGKLLTSDTGQPVFHVEHSVGGTESRPLSYWRVANLTDASTTRDRLISHFTCVSDEPWLYEFIEIYIRSDLHVDLTRRTDS